MIKKIKTLAVLISTSLTSDADTLDNDLLITKNISDSNILNFSLLNNSVSHTLAAHRSHASHASHRSSSSSRSSYSTPSYSNTTPAPKTTTYDPLGQQVKPKMSYPTKKKNNIIDSKKKSNIVMRIQLILQFENMYTGSIDGILGPSTRKAIDKYKKKFDITTKKYLDTETLNAFGIKGY